MASGRLNTALGAVVIVLGGIGGFMLGYSLDDSVREGVYFMPYVRIFLRGSHTHGLLMAFYNLIFAMLLGTLSLSRGAKRAASILAAGSLLLPIGLGLRGLTGGAMTFAPVALLGGVCFIVSAIFILAGLRK